MSDHADDTGNTGRVIAHTFEARQFAADQRSRERKPEARRGDRLLYTDVVARAAHAQGLEPELLHALIDVESAYRPRALSARGAQGLMQLMPATARRYAVVDAMDPRENVEAGARHLRELLDLFKQNKRLALAAYNAGAAAVLRHGSRIPPFAETLAYVPKVLSRYESLRSTTSTQPR